MNMQKHYELEVAKDEMAEKIERDVRPFEPASTRKANRNWRQARSHRGREAGASPVIGSIRHAGRR